MTELIDPQQAAFWASDPSILSDPNTLVDPSLAVAEPVTPHHRLRLALEIAAAFVVCAQLVRIALATKHSADDPKTAAEKAWADVAPIFTSLATVAIGQSLRLDPATSELSVLELGRVASQYAKGLGSYLGTTSTASFLQAIDRQLSGRWGDGIAFTRAAVGYGMDPQGYAAFLKAAAATVDTEVVTPAVQALADSSLLNRAQLVGESEAQTAGETVKALHWQQMQEAGVLPDTARRMWVTDHREGDCAVCGALDGAIAGLYEPFEVDGFELWSPQAHPNCRCHLQLVDVVGKAYNPQEKRETRGSAHPGRWAKVAEPNAVVEEMMAQARAQTQEKTEEKTAVISPFGEKTASPFGEASPFGRGGGASTAFAPTASTAFQASPFGEKGSAAFAGSRAFRPARPNIRVQRSRITVPPPEMEVISAPYYMPTDHYQAEVDEHAVGVLLGMYTDIDFDVAHPTKYGHLHAQVQATPWDALSYDDRARGRLDTQWRTDREGNSVEVPRVSQPEVRTMWDILLPDAYRGWHDAIRGAVDIDDKQMGIVADLTPADRWDIAVLAGFNDYSNDDDLKDKIAQATQDLGSGNDSLASAYADYVVYHRPDLLGELGDEISAHLSVADQVGIKLDNRPVDQVMSFENGFHDNTRVSPDSADPRGKYIATGFTYRSALHDLGMGAPPLAMGIQVAHMQPYIRHAQGFLFPKGTETQ